MPDNNTSTTADHENEKKPRKIGCVTIMWVVALVGGFFFWFNGLREVPLRISSETTYITEPLTADGKHIDYFTTYKQMVTPPNIATDDNGYRLVFQHLGDTAWSEKPSPEAIQKLCEELGLDPNTQPDMEYVNFYTFVNQLEKLRPEKYEETVELVKQYGGRVDPFEIARFIAEQHDNPHIFPATKLWVEENGPVLDLIAETVAKPMYFAPIVSTRESPGLMESYYNTGNFQESRDFARSFQLRIRYRVGIGDFDGAIDDILACYRLGRHIAGRGSMLDVLVGIAIEGIAATVAIDVSYEKRATVKQLERLAEGIRNLPPMMTMEHCFELDRYITLDMIQSVAIKARKMSEVFPIPSRLAMVVDRLGYDWNLIARITNERIDSLIAGTYTSTLPPGTIRIDYDYRPWLWLTLGSRSQEMAEVFCMGYEHGDMFCEALRRAECADNMRQITLAMLIYERRNGTLPPTFLVDKNGKPLHNWRVLLLPYLGNDSLAELYSQIKLDEPWDSEHNRQFHTRNIDIYRCPSAVNNDGESNYSVIVGDDLLFGNDGHGRSLDSRKRHQIILAERKEGVCWMQPDAEITQHTTESDGINKTATSISSNHIGGANFGWCDGSVKFLTETIVSSQLNDFIRGTDIKEY